MTRDWKKKRRFRKALARSLQIISRRNERVPPYQGPLHSIAILAQEKYGDAILLTPLLKNLKIRFPECRIHLITFSKASTAFFRNDPNVWAVHYAKGNPADYLQDVLFHRFDLLFNTKDHPSTNFLLQSLLVRAKSKVGIDNDFHRGLFDYLIKTGFHTHIVRKNCALLEILGQHISVESCRPYIPPMPVSEEIETFSASLQPGTVAGINISAGGPTRYWTEEKWSEVVNNHPSVRFVLFSTPDDLDQKRHLEDRHANVIASPPTANLYETSLIIEKLMLVISPDTAMIHAASCCNVPVVGLYGVATQDQTRFSPFLVPYEMVVSPTAHVRDITVRAVEEAVQKFI
ncbi:glycosyl transferase family 9 [Prosthecochloris aestuarii DSM 271]|uniref:Glycosyl transferase family 9 n=1 Tax=Prosthecochloris aestuarii (strain DSM 271 / SK 413) TaxID=290512 RepID=B4S4G3_PROA2|nr:glycosyltransferase family 9 protein [Prosthecochloris aestuarii]ACF45411.1 glycosyl transferase family 9 [Prosthecochloris aestuarii DSM 271]